MTTGTASGHPNSASQWFSILDPVGKTGQVLTVARLDGALGRRPASPRSSVAAGSSGFHGTGVVDWPPKEVSSLHFYVKVIFFYQKLISIKL